MALNLRCNQKDPIARQACRNQNKLIEEERAAEAALKKAERQAAANVAKAARQAKQKQQQDDRLAKQAERQARLAKERRERADIVAQEKKEARDERLTAIELKTGGGRTNRDLLDTITTVSTDVHGLLGLTQPTAVKPPVPEDSKMKWLPIVLLAGGALVLVFFLRKKKG